MGFDPGPDRIRLRGLPADARDAFDLTKVERRLQGKFARCTTLFSLLNHRLKKRFHLMKFGWLLFAHSMLHCRPNGRRTWSRRPGFNP
jgi:hypothetical protein